MAADTTVRFPFISLEKALGRAGQIYEGDRSGKQMAVSTAFELWGYSPKSSGGFQTISALKAYGLLDDDGANDDRKVRLTNEARKYFLDERDEVRQGMLATFALSPTLFKILWEKDGWSEGLPADPVARSHLKIERHLNDQSARALLSILKDNIQFAGLRGGAATKSPLESGPPEGQTKPDQEPTKGGSMEKTQSPVWDPFARPQPVAAPSKPIMFDMETVSGQYQFDNADDLGEFIAKLEKIKALMPSKH
ncbi:hypothetical protein EOB36_09730 [Mesorhizobium sp. M6A.T.Cr.TU.017.01.1.1]|uniref:hypothetical protein n=1 Tax=Mesorhizobium sp. M6A.T.Cr.TU.017.01.1.1 TaxID=2496774 RepID=UPI000FD5DA9A|nr:hypothetical protein [Mesorhizobium sp. M6A.T.Cr.TU.017.01.1.1]RUV02399.1 hypothetical protein EOB36_09730 [Mesorhizobium sp. M6A.T.Cr.TU.017.01.1.1]